MGLRGTQDDGNGAEDASRAAVPAATSVELERRVVLHALAGEVSHELAHTLNFLRVLVEDIPAGEALTTEDRALAQKEVRRVAAVLGQLRQLRLPVTEHRPVPLREVLLRASAAAQSAVPGATLAVGSSLDRDLTLAADPALLFILLRDVLADVLQRLRPSETVEAQVFPPGRAPDAQGTQAGRLDIMGPARRLAPSTASDHLDPRAPDALASAGMRLAVAIRLARLFGWTLDEITEGTREGLRLRIPATAFGVESDGCAS